MRLNLLIIAQSGRALAQFARKADLRCVVLDCFGDEDTGEYADAVEVVGSADHGFDANRLLAAVEKYSPASQVISIVAGSGFEDRPDLLAAVSEGRQFTGIAPGTIRSVKDPALFFHTLRRLQIPHPEILLEGEPTGEGWLMKRIGGCGGTHIRYWRSGGSLLPGYYLQREVQGTPMSAVVLSNGREARVIGYNELWLSPAADQPFRFGGAVSVWPDPAVQLAVIYAVQELLQPYDLIGLFGIDVVRDSSGEIAILEVNPRPPATFPLHEGTESLLAAHLAACAGEMPDWQADKATHRAQAILYAETAFTIPSDWQWPDWTADRPAPGTVIHRGEPLCTVLAEADTALEARDLAAWQLRGVMDELLA